MYKPFQKLQTETLLEYIFFWIVYVLKNDKLLTRENNQMHKYKQKYLQLADKLKLQCHQPFREFVDFIIATAEFLGHWVSEG